MNALVKWSRNCAAILCWASLVVLLNGSAGAPSITPDQDQTRSETALGQKYTEWDLTFLRDRPSFMSSSQPIRPYSLSINEEDYHYTPKPKHLRPVRLLRTLGASFDPFWMSIERPSEAGVWTSEGGSDTDASGQTLPRRDSLAPDAPLPNYTTVNKGFNLPASPELIEGAARYQRKLEKEAEDLDLSLLSSDVASTVRDWLVRSATCGLRHQWVDLGPVFWPRWLRHTDCEKSGGSPSCSFPSGMACRRAQVTQIKILAWHCWGAEEGGGDGSKGMARADRATVVGKVGSNKKCMWRQVPYPVVTACKCSCK